VTDGAAVAAARLRQDYRPAFLRYLSRRDETARAAGYELGRRAVGDAVSLLELVDVHHVILLDVLPDAADETEATEVFTAASEFLTEALASYALASAALPAVQQRLRESQQELREARSPQKG
jgi:hypothetical protein